MSNTAKQLIGETGEPEAIPVTLNMTLDQARWLWNQLSIAADDELDYGEQADMHTAQQLVVQLEQQMSAIFDLDTPAEPAS